MECYSWEAELLCKTAGLISADIIFFSNDLCCATFFTFFTLLWLNWMSFFLCPLVDLHIHMETQQQGCWVISVLSWAERWPPNSSSWPVGWQVFFKNFFPSSLFSVSWVTSFNIFIHSFAVCFLLLDSVTHTWAHSYPAWWWFKIWFLLASSLLLHLTIFPFSLSLFALWISGLGLLNSQNNSSAAWAICMAADEEQIWCRGGGEGEWKKEGGFGYVVKE